MSMTSGNNMASNANNVHSSMELGHDAEIEEMDFSNGEHFHDEDLATGSSKKDETFDIVIGHIEDIVMEEHFQRLQTGFLEKHYLEFEDTEENKFCYTEIHNEYISLIESFLESELKKRVPDFSMDIFSKQLLERKKELEGEIFEILLTFSDFLAFKEMLLDYRSDKEGHTVDLSGELTVKPVHDSFSLKNSLHGP